MNRGTHMHTHIVTERGREREIEEYSPMGRISSPNSSRPESRSLAIHSRSGSETSVNNNNTNQYGTRVVRCIHCIDCIMVIFLTNCLFIILLYTWLLWLWWYVWEWVCGSMYTNSPIESNEWRCKRQYIARTTALQMGHRDMRWHRGNDNIRECTSTLAGGDGVESRLHLYTLMSQVTRDEKLVSSNQVTWMCNDYTVMQVSSLAHDETVEQLHSDDKRDTQWLSVRHGAGLK